MHITNLTDCKYLIFTPADMTMHVVVPGTNPAIPFGNANCKEARLKWDAAPNYGWQALWYGGSVMVQGAMVGVYPPCGNPTTGYTAVWAQSSPTSDVYLTIY